MGNGPGDPFYVVAELDAISKRLKSHVERVSRPVFIAYVERVSRPVQPPVFHPVKKNKYDVLLDAKRTEFFVLVGTKMGNGPGDPFYVVAELDAISKRLKSHVERVASRPVFIAYVERVASRPVQPPVFRPVEKNKYDVLLDATRTEFFVLVGTKDGERAWRPVLRCGGSRLSR